MSRAAQKRNPGRGSQRLHRALGGTRILLAAAPTAPPCFCRWQRSSLLLFESTRPISLALLQNKNLSVLAYAEAFWWARVDCASRAYDKESGLRLPASASLPLASCWPRPQPRLPVSATGGGRLRCCSNPP